MLIWQVINKGSILIMSMEMRGEDPSCFHFKWAEQIGLHITIKSCIIRIIPLNYFYFLYIKNKNNFVICPLLKNSFMIILNVKIYE